MHVHEHNYNFDSGFVLIFGDTFYLMFGEVNIHYKIKAGDQNFGESFKLRLKFKKLKIQSEKDFKS